MSKRRICCFAVVVSLFLCVLSLSSFAGPYDSAVVSCYANGLDSGVTLGRDYGYFGGLALFCDASGQITERQIVLSSFDLVSRSGGVDYRIDVDQSWLSARPGGLIPSDFSLSLLVYCSLGYELTFGSRLCNITVSELDSIPIGGRFIWHPSDSGLVDFNAVNFGGAVSARAYSINLVPKSRSTTTLDLFADLSFSEDIDLDDDYVSGFGGYVSQFYRTFDDIFESNLILELLGVTVGGLVLCMIVKWVVTL